MKYHVRKLYRCIPISDNIPYTLCFSESDSGIFRQILRGKLDFSSAPWPQISESAKDLITKMLDRRPQQRITAHEVLCELQNHSIFFLSLFYWYDEVFFYLAGHPWIIDDKVAPDKPLDSAVISRLKHFSAMNKLKKMALRVWFFKLFSFTICLKGVIFMV